MKKSEQTIKSQLLKRLSEITKKKSDKLLIVAHNGGGKSEITTEYDAKEFGYAPGQFIQIMIGGCPCSQRLSIALCVGVGVGCPDNPEEQELWFLFEEDEGISHFCGGRAKDFEERGAVLLT